MMASSAGKMPQGQPAAGNGIFGRELAAQSFYGEPEAPSQAAQGPSVVNGHALLASKPPLPPQAKKQRQLSDSELSEISEGDQGSDFEAGNFDDSDFSEDSSSRKRQKLEAREAARKRHKSPEDNEMRRKLRGNTPQDDASRQPSAERASETEAMTEEEEEDPTAVPARIVSPEEEAQQKAALKTDWQLIAVLDFLSIFQPYLRLEHLQFSAEELGSALVLHSGTSGLLPELHIGLMKGISSRSNLHGGNWPTSLAEKLKIHWRTGGLSGAPPFVSQRRREAATYALLPLENRVTALRILCELRLDREDLHNVVELALHPPRKTKAERKAAQAAAKAGRPPPPGPILPTMAQMRREPLARDSSGLLYWYLDYHTTTGTRMYREMPESLLRAKTKKDQSEPQWELIASSPEDLTELAEKLRRSKKKPDQNLADIILEELIPELLERRENDLKKQRAAAKIQSQLNNILPDDEGGYGGRSRRNRKTVNYSFDAYDAVIRAALKGGKSEEPEGRSTRSQAFFEPRMTAEEEALIGLRRGRSAHAAEASQELPPNRRLRGSSSAAASAEPSPDITAEPTPESSTEAASGSAAPSLANDRASGEENGVSMDLEKNKWQASENSYPESMEPSGNAQDSAEVEISELDSRDDYKGCDDGEEEISSLSGGSGGHNSLEYIDDSNDEDWA